MQYAVKQNDRVLLNDRKMVFFSLSLRIKEQLQIIEAHSAMFNTIQNSILRTIVRRSSSDRGARYEDERQRRKQLEKNDSGCNKTFSVGFEHMKMNPANDIFLSTFKLKGDK